jgi:fructose-1,6-bisphosphatase/sedoheptulose 1,7-bisphosphatase-like protein
VGITDLDKKYDLHEMVRADAIFAASAGVELPTNPIRITTATVASP